LKNSALLLIISFVLLSGCRPERKVTPDVRAEEKDGASDAEEEASASGSEKRYSGLFVVGKNVLSFRPCDDPQTDWAVADSTGKMKDLYKTLVLQSPAFPYEYVYVEVRGALQPAGEYLQSRGYDSTLVIEQVLTFEQKNYQNDCIPYDFWALGDEWSLQISMREGVMVLKDFKTRQAYVFEYFPPLVRQDERMTYSSNNYAIQASIRAVISKEDCSDQAGNSFQYSASVMLNGKRYSGCAIKGSSLQ
jgi:uncharacterized membrane protein